MARCRCKVSCPIELQPGDLVVEVKKYNKADQPTHVLLSHLVPPTSGDMESVAARVIDEKLGK